jgi:hypothetical protein
VIEKPVETVNRTITTPLRSQRRLPPRHESLRTTVGVGYVQGADWGTELMASGSAGGRQVQLQTLITGGREGMLFDSGALSVFDPQARWRAELGDLFSNLRGASRGGRVSWQTAGGRWRPSLAVYGPRRGSGSRATVVAYRDQWQVGRQTLLDAEFASDRSLAIRNRFQLSRLDVETMFRSMKDPSTSRDASLAAGVTLWHGISLNGAVFRAFETSENNDWRTIGVRFPIAKFLSVTLERAHAATPRSSQRTTAAMASVVAGDLRLFHRFQLGTYDLAGSGYRGSLDRQQTQSFASYNAGTRVNVVMQLATQRAENGRVQHWEEMQTTLRLTSKTTLRTVTAVPDVRDAKRWRGFFRQELPSRFAFQVDYGRLSAFQSIPNELDRSRFKVMLFKTWDLATPGGGGEVEGRVLDTAGRGVAGAGVKLGSFFDQTDATGSYRFVNVPAGAYDVSLDRDRLPADVAWDGRAEPITVSARRRVRRDLRVVPLNSIHGRVYCDRNGNGRYDSGEAISGVVMLSNNRVTATDQHGSYSFFNLWPGPYRVRIDSGKLPPNLEPAGAMQIDVTLGGDAPVTQTDFRVRQRPIPVIWSDRIR